MSKHQFETPTSYIGVLPKNELLVLFKEAIVQYPTEWVVEGMVEANRSRIK
jgi:hypothetical protein